MPELDKSKIDKVMKDERQKNEAFTFNDKLGTEDRQQIVRMILKEVKKDETDNARFISKRNEILDVYEGKRNLDKPKVDPFPGCADVKTMLTASNVELLHSKILPSIHNDELTFWRARESSDVPYVDNIRKFMGTYATQEADFQRFVDDWAYNIILEGTEITKARWNREYRWIVRRIPNAKNLSQKLVEKAKLFLGYPARDIRITHKDYKIQYDYIKLEKAVLDDIPLEDVGFPVWQNGRTDVNQLHHIWHRYPMLLSDIQQIADEGIFDSAEVDHCGSERKEQIVAAAGTSEKRESHEGAQGTKPPDDEVECLVIERHGKIKIPEVGMVECVTWVEKESQTFLGCMPEAAILYTGERPFVISQFVRRKGRMYGKALAELGLMEIENEVNSIHCQRLDAAKMAIVPPAGYRPASGFNPEMVRMAPGLVLPLDNPREDFVWYGLANNIVQGVQEESMLINMAERLTSIGDLQSGQESGTVKTRATARGTLALIAQSERRFGTLAARMQVQLAKILKLLLRMWQTHMPPGLENRILGQNGERLFPEGFSAEDIAGEFDVFLSLDPLAGSKTAQRESFMGFYQEMLKNPLVVQSASHLWELSHRLAMIFDIQDSELILGPKPPDQTMDKPKTAQDEINELAQGRLPTTKPGEDIDQIAAGLQLFMQSSEFKSLEPEKQELVKVRFLTLQAEAINRASGINFQQMQQQQIQGGMNAPIGAGGIGQNPQESVLAGAGGGQPGLPETGEAG